MSLADIEVEGQNAIKLPWLQMMYLCTTNFRGDAEGAIIAIVNL